MVGKKAVLMLVLLSLGLVAATFQPVQAVKMAKIDFEGLAEGDIVDNLSHGAGISGDPIEGDVTVFGSNPNFPGNPPDNPAPNTAMIFDTTCAGGCSGGDDDLKVEQGNVLIISEDLDPSDPDDAESPGDFYFNFDFSKFGNGTVNLKKLTYADIDGNEAPGSIEVYKGTQPVKDPIALPQTGDNRKREVNIDANDINRLVVKFNGSMMIDNIEIETETNGQYNYYLPLAPKARPPKFDVTIGYEDRLRTDLDRIDYDYNDWAISIFTEFEGDFVDEDTIKLEKITFEMIPKARGGKIEHEFHLRIDANTFTSDGDYELVIKGKPGVPVHLPDKGPFIASEGRDVHVNFHRTGCDCEAFGEDEGETPVFYNVCEVKEIEKNASCLDQSIKNDEAVRWAVLSITFDKPFPFHLPGYGQHCQGLFFDPYLKVEHDGIPDEVSRTQNIKDPNPDPRILCVEDPYWQWPEEGVRIDRAYPDVEITCKRGKPPTFEFLEGWDGNHNSCVFDDEVCKPEVDLCN